MIHGDFNVLSPLVQNFSFLKNYVNFFGGQVGDFQVATSGGFWVAIGVSKAAAFPIKISESSYLSILFNCGNSSSGAPDR